MKRYKYKAKRSPTEIVEGDLIAVSQDEAIEKINRLGMMPVELEELRVSEKRVRIQTSAMHVPKKEITHAYQQLGHMMKTGMPLLSALALLTDQTNHAPFKEVLTRIQNDVREGRSLSAALSNYEKIFPSLENALIRAGENVGRLDDALARIVSYRKKQLEMERKIKSALLYPFVVFGLGVLTVIFMLGYVIPRFSEFFLDLGQELPLLTQILIAVSKAVEMSWIGIVAGIYLLILMTKKIYFSNKKNLKAFHKTLLKIPIYGKIILFSEISRFTRTLQNLVQAGIPLTRAVEVSAPVLNNEAIREEVKKSGKQMEQGGSLSLGLQQSALFPAGFLQVLRMGEQSGHLEESLADLSEWYEEETADMLKTMTQLLEPAMIVLVGGVLGLIIIAVLLPIFSLNAMIT